MSSVNLNLPVHDAHIIQVSHDCNSFEIRMRPVLEISCKFNTDDTEKDIDWDFELENLITNWNYELFLFLNPDG